MKQRMVWWLFGLGFFALPHFSQGQMVQYFTYNWQPCEPGDARFVRNQTKTDSGFLVEDFYLNPVRRQMIGHYADAQLKQRHGRFQFFYADGRRESDGLFLRGQPEGLLQRWHWNGMMADSGHWQQGKRIGIHLQWHTNGLMKDSITVQPDGNAVHVLWDYEGNVQGAGRLDPGGHRQGAWVLYHPDGKAAAKLAYQNGKLLDSAFFDARAQPLPANAGEEMEADFPGGLGKWRQYLVRRLIWPDNVRLENTSMVTVVIDFTIGADGQVRDAFVRVPFDRVFDNLALRIIKESPKWMPAKQGNVFVPFSQRQAVNFQQSIGE